MNLATILMILQIAFGLLQNPTVQASPALKAQVTGFATQALALAAQYQTTIPPEPAATSTPPDATTTPAQPTVVASAPVTDPGQPLHVIVPYVPPADTTQPQITFGVQTPAPAVPPTLPTNADPTRYPASTNTSVTFKFSGGDYDSLKVNLYATPGATNDPGTPQIQASIVPTSYDVTSNPFTITGLTSSAAYACSITAVKGNLTTTSSVLATLPYAGRYIPQNCGFSTSAQ